jgi:N-acetylglucosaminyldiphosphoundecaprenol N-acetyl-beta-D-mannosaminyltransferase
MINEMKVNKSHKDAEILKVEISSTDMDGVLEFVRGKLAKRQKFFISTPNPEMIVEAQGDSDFLEAINSSDLAIPDGIGLLWAMKVQVQVQDLKRLAGREVMLRLFEEADGNGWKVFLLGSTETVNRRACEKANKEFPSARFEGDGTLVLNKKGEGDTKLAISYEKDVVDRINKFAPDLLFVAFGAPKQEKWVKRNFERLNVGGVMVVGGALDYYVGKKPLPPKVFSSLGLEWAWRMVHERGHYRRVWRAVVVFPWLVLKSRLSKSP